MAEFIHAFVVPGIPQGKGRPKFVRKTGHAYTPEKTESYEALVRMACRWHGAPVEGPLKVAITATFPRPKSWSKKKAAASVWHTSKPDQDNLAKVVCDALNGVLWVDDSQIAIGLCEKVYGDVPGLSVWVGRL